jgi:hypothetical protein
MWISHRGFTVDFGHGHPLVKRKTTILLHAQFYYIQGNESMSIMIGMQSQSLKLPTHPIHKQEFKT